MNISPASMGLPADKRYSIPEIPVALAAASPGGLIQQFRIYYMCVILQGDYSQ